MISIEQHVLEMWTVDPTDSLSIAQSKGLLPRSPDKNLPDLCAPEGLLVVLRLRKFEDFESEIEEKEEEEEVVLSKGRKVESGSGPKFGDSKRRDEDDDGGDRKGNHDNDEEEEEEEEDESKYKKKTNKYTVTDNTAESIRKSMMFNPLKRSLSPFCTTSTSTSLQDTSSSSSTLSAYSLEPECIAIFAPIGSRVSAALSSALVSWRATLRAQDKPEHRGGGGGRGSAATATATATAKGKNNSNSEYDGSLPIGILRAFIAAIDTYSIADCTGQGSGLSFGLNRDRDISGGLRDMIFDESIAVTANMIQPAAMKLCGLPGTGFLAMRYDMIISLSVYYNN